MRGQNNNVKKDRGVCVIMAPSCLLLLGRVHDNHYAVFFWTFLHNEFIAPFLHQVAFADLPNGYEDGLITSGNNATDMDGDFGVSIETHDKPEPRSGKGIEAGPTGFAPGI